MSELKPCPFCGEEPEDPQISQIEYNSYIASITCICCFSVVSLVYTKASEALAIDEVVEAWNRRVRSECLCAKELPIEPISTQPRPPHNGVLVKQLLDVAFDTIQPDRPEDNPSEPHIRSALAGAFWKILDGEQRIEDRREACARQWDFNDFPPLPEPASVKRSGFDAGDYFSADQMREYAIAARAATSQVATIDGRDGDLVRMAGEIAEDLDAIADRITRFSNNLGDGICMRAAQLLRALAARPSKT